MIFDNHDYTEEPKTLVIAVTQDPSDPNTYNGIIFNPEMPKPDDERVYNRPSKGHDDEPDYFFNSREVVKKGWELFDAFFQQNQKRDVRYRRKQPTESQSQDPEPKAKGLLAKLQSILPTKKQTSRPTLPDYTPDFKNPFKEDPDFNNPMKQVPTNSNLHTNRFAESHQLPDNKESSDSKEKLKYRERRPGPYQTLKIMTECGPAELVSELYEHFDIDYNPIRDVIPYKIARFKATADQLKQMHDLYQEKPFHYLRSPIKLELDSMDSDDYDSDIDDGYDGEVYK